MENDVKIQHRVIDKIEEKRQKGQIVHFLTGSGIQDNYFYNYLEGVLNLADSLKTYYLRKENEKNSEKYDFLIHCSYAAEAVSYYKKNRNGEIAQIDFKDLKAPKRGGAFARETQNRTDSKLQEEAQKEAEDATKGHDVALVTGRIGELLKEGKKIVLLLEGLEWISKMYDAQQDLRWIGILTKWAKENNLLVVATIKDFESIKKYGFEQEETFIGNPSALEIRYTYLRYLLRKTNDNYYLDLKVLQDVTQALSAGKKSLVDCMRILSAVLAKNKVSLVFEDFKDSINKNIPEEVKLSDVRLDYKTKASIKASVDKLMDSPKEARKGLILTGPPGTGKTMIVKALANEEKCYFMAPTLGDLKGEYIGQSSGKIKRIFAEARANQPTILFIDEADTVFPSRNMGSQGDSFGLDMVNQFLQEIDGATTGEQKIFTIAATNRVDVVDSAIRSRLSEVITIGLPDKEMRRLIFEDNLGFSIKGKCYEEHMLEKSEKMAGRDITNFVKKLKEKAKLVSIELGKDDAIDNELIAECFGNKEREAFEEIQRTGLIECKTPGEIRNRFSDVIGYDDIKTKIKRKAEYISYNEDEKLRFENFGLEISKGTLLYGPPGNAKSMLAEAVAGEFGFYFFKVVSKNFVSLYANDTIKKLADIFSRTIQFSKIMSEAKGKGKGIVLFFDEFDSLAGSLLSQDIRGSLLDFLSDQGGLRNKDSKILFMAATNYYETIDEAVKRKGRIDEHIFMDNPTEENGKSMLDNLFKKDKHIKQPVANKVLTGLYAKLLEISRRQIKEAIKIYENTGDAGLKKGWEQKLANTRPSGSDLRNAYQEMKNIAYYMDGKREPNQLIIDEDVLRAYSPEIRNS